MCGPIYLLTLTCVYMHVFYQVGHAVGGDVSDSEGHGSDESKGDGSNSEVSSPLIQRNKEAFSRYEMHNGPNRRVCILRTA